MYQLVAITGLIKSFLSYRVQRVTLNGQTSHWECKQVVVPQGSIIEPFFLIYTNELTANLKLKVKLPAVGTSLFSIVSEPLKKLQAGLNSGKWLLISRVFFFKKLNLFIRKVPPPKNAGLKLDKF